MKRLSLQVATFFKKVLGAQQYLTPPTSRHLVRLREGMEISTDLYLPTVSQQNANIDHPTLILLHGMAPLGGQDPRIIHLANILSQLGYRVIVPHFPIVSAYLFTPETVDDYAHFFMQIANNYHLCPSHQFGIFTFSLSGPIALKATTLYDNAKSLTGFFTLGSPYSLQNVFEAALVDPEYDRFTKLVILKNVLYHAKAVDERIITALRLQIQWESDYCPEELLFQHLNALPSTIKAQYDNLLQTLPNTQVYYQQYQSIITALDRQFQSLGNYQKIQFPVFLMHSKKDAIFHASETIQLSKYLKSLGVKHKKLITTVFDHAMPAISPIQVYQGLRVYSIFYQYMRVLSKYEAKLVRIRDSIGFS